VLGTCPGGYLGLARTRDRGSISAATTALAVRSSDASDHAPAALGEQPAKASSMSSLDAMLLVLNGTIALCLWAAR
jgi:hypothetical protein